MAIQGAKLALAGGIADIVSAGRVFAQTTPTDDDSKSTLQAVTTTWDKRAEALSDASGEASNSSFGSTFRVAQNLPASTDESKGNSGAESSPPSASPSRDLHSKSDTDRNSSADIEEVVVTAEKRPEPLQDVPVPVTAISGQTLVDTNQLRIQDWHTSIPGLSFSSGVHGEPFAAIRGITADYDSNPSVGVTIDDVPYGSSTGLGGGYIAPDIDPSDLARVEV